ncbi:AI-2E family transporter [Bacillus altitudinis]|uniref:AI-2E family transporter n=1 Tax=Bacillus altitudinis TaxID=293387 RepID=UPI0011A3EE3D|nr:AI-2E family transporter [Bacillus altitudinis]
MMSWRWRMRSWVKVWMNGMEINGVRERMIVGRRVDMDRVVMMVVLLGGGEVFGLIGMILGVAWAGIMRVMIVEYIDMRGRVD